MGRNRKPIKSITTAAEVAPVNIDNVPVFDASTRAFSNIVANVVRLSPEQQDLLIEQQKMNPFVLAAIGMYGGVNQRQRVFEMLDEPDNGFAKEISGTVSVTASGSGMPAKFFASNYFQNNSLDYLLFKAKKEGAARFEWLSKENPTMSDDRKKELSKLVTDKKFTELFWRWWAGFTQGSTTRAGWGMLNLYMSQVGPNAEVPQTMDFFPNYPHLKGYVPALNPEVVQILQKEYENTQKALERAGVPEVVTLYRGTHQPRGLPLESFSEQKAIAELFANEVNFSELRVGQGEVRTEQVPRKYIFGKYSIIETWRESGVRGKKENMVLGTAFYANEQRLQRQERATGRGAGRKFDYLSPEGFNPDTESWDRP